ncbi:MAG TPA: alpha/beta hydrolase [Planococcus sp. (in: firmicutes)]|nr:alpha/beta hydrolase [Planococcus sp. (in: firmicutes)]
MPYAVVDDSVSLYYEIKGHGLPIVFVHPPVMGHQVFMHQELLSTHYQTIFYDLRGHGRSSVGKTPLSILLLANDLKKLLDAIGIEKAVICGFSNGGTIAQEFALLYPERTAALILSSAYPKVDHLGLKSLIVFGMAMSKIHQIPRLAKMQAKTHKYYQSDEKKLYDYAKKANAQSVYEFCKAGLQYDSTHSLYRLTMPVLMIYGSQEKPMHHHQNAFLRSAQHVEVVYIKGVSHETPPKKFPEFNETVHRFLQNINKPSVL